MFATDKCLRKGSNKKSEWIRCEVCKRWYHYECVGLSFQSPAEASQYIFSCPSHTEEIEDITYRVRVKQDDLKKSTIDVDEISCTELRRKVSGRAESKKLSGPSYVEYEGVKYHISRFQSLLLGKTYCPSASRQERWKSTNRACFFIV